MKKLMWTMSAVVLSFTAAVAQDTTRTQTDRFRADPMEQDTTAIDYYQNQQMDQSQDTTMQNQNEGLYEYRDPQETDEVDLDSTFNRLNEELEQDAPMNDREPVAQDTAALSGTDPEGDEVQPVAAAGAEIEVLENKEGPNHEVVYEINGDYFYVDRKKEELVKVERSALRDSDHEVEIKEGTAAEDQNQDRKKSKR